MLRYLSRGRFKVIVWDSKKMYWDWSFYLHYVKKNLSKIYFIFFFKLEIESFGESRKYNINLLGKRQNSFKNLSWSGT